MPNLFAYTFVLEKGQNLIFSETIAACGLKIGRCGDLNEFMKLDVYSKSRSVLDVVPRSFRYENKNVFSHKLLGHL